MEKPSGRQTEGDPGSGWRTTNTRISGGRFLPAKDRITVAAAQCPRSGLYPTNRCIIETDRKDYRTSFQEISGFLTAVWSVARNSTAFSGFPGGASSSRRRVDLTGSGTAVGRLWKRIKLPKIL